jgi:hypothetical protein
MNLQNPLKEVFVTQLFGENAAFYEKNYGIKGHNGIDFRAVNGTPVYASHDGYAYFEWDSAQGEGVVIRSKEQMVINGVPTFFKTIYWHLCDAGKQPNFKSPITCYDVNALGQEVKTGDLIGYADNTGLTSTGSHLHFGLKPISAGESLGGTYNPMQNNGYAGAIDPMPYLPSKFKFNNDMRYGDENEDVKELQKRLIGMGYSIPAGATGFYGTQTQKAVFIYQQVAGVPLTLADRLWYRGQYCGLKTRTVLNNT